ncbi:MAG: HD domain-containing protein [Bacteroidales bacterium]|nr:HD domain-containing protein [Bacteroidales bacterium]
MGQQPSHPKLKMFNDPVYGFITIPSDIAFRIIEHPYFQRLRRIKQLGLSHLVYPGALHTRFQHSLGAMHLMTEALDSLQTKGYDISKHEIEMAEVAALLHDVGHGPFSHALENSIVDGINHEGLSLLFMHRLNNIFGGDIETAIEIFKNNYPKKYLHHLVSGQLDVDRLDYLKRDSFFCGVAEGIVNNDRIIKTINVLNDNIGIDAKGMYSVEKFIIARRLMYWQVYLHKTVLSAEALLIRILRRAKFLAGNGEKLFGTPSLLFFLEHRINSESFLTDPTVLERFANIDDFDVFTSVKTWANHPDFILSTLSRWLVNRELYRVEMQPDPFENSYVENIRDSLYNIFPIRPEEADYFLFTDVTSNYSYDPFDNRISILLKNGEIMDLTEASGLFNLTIMTGPDTKYVLGYPKKIKYMKNSP